MDIADLERVQALRAEAVQLEAAQAAFDGDAIITSFTYEWGPASPSTGMRRTGMIATGYMTYPPQMVDTIKSLMTARLHEIEDELNTLGITGIAAR